MPPSPHPPHGTGTRQDQFLTVLPRDEAIRRFDAALFPRSPRVEDCPLDHALNRVVAEDIISPADVPPFDRSNVDGFALRAADVAGASQTQPVRLALTGESIHCGTPPQREVTPGHASAIATGGPLPRGADAVVMIEQTRMDAAGPEKEVEILHPIAPGQHIAHAGSDILRGEMLLRRRTTIGPAEIGMLAAAGVARVRVVARPRVAILSTGDELVQPGEPLRPAAVHDANGAIISAAVTENGGIADFRGAIPDDEGALDHAMRAALAASDMLIVSGGTSKGAGDLSHRIIARLGPPGIIAHGVALKPGKPLCLAVCGGKPVVILPGFPTSAMFTFHDIIVPVLRRMAGLPPRDDATVTARVPLAIPSERGRAEFVMVSLVHGADEQELVAYPLGKGSGAITAFARADGFLRIDALADQLAAGSRARVTLFSPRLQLPDLVIIGSHCTGLDVVLAPLVRAGLRVRVLAVGSLGGVAAARRGECDLAPMHLLDEESGIYNAPWLDADQELIPGWRRMQGVVHRSGDARFKGKTAEEAVAAALADPSCLMVNRNQGAGTRILIERLLAGARPGGYWNQPRSHNAVAAAVAQGRADWGVTIAPVARAAGLSFMPLTEEHYDFALVRARKPRPPVQAFLDALRSDEVRAGLAKAGFQPA